MKIINIIDSLELNGGSTMFLEMTAAMQKYWSDDEICPYVVSKTGRFGREGLVSGSFAPSHGVKPQLYDYATFEKEVVPKTRKALVFHHVLGYTKNIVFHKSCKYVVINHTATNVKRLPGFAAYRLVCVSGYFANKVKKENESKRKLRAFVILNGCEDYFHIEPSVSDSRFVIGRCQRIVPTKFRNEKINVKNTVQYIIGPVRDEISDILPKNAEIFGPIFDMKEKLPIIRSFDVYLHGAPRPEGCSMAILEALSCGVPVIAKDVGGGVREVIKSGVNGFLYQKTPELRKILRDLSSDPVYLAKIKKQVREDFLARFHIKHMLKQYKGLTK